MQRIPHYRPDGVLWQLREQQHSARWLRALFAGFLPHANMRIKNAGDDCGIDSPALIAVATGLQILRANCALSTAQWCPCRSWLQSLSSLSNWRRSESEMLGNACRDRNHIWLKTAARIPKRLPSRALRNERGRIERTRGACTSGPDCENWTLELRCIVRDNPSIYEAKKAPFKKTGFTQ